MNESSEGKPEAYGGEVHQKLVDFAVAKLRREGINNILFEVDPGTGISIDIIGIKNGHRTGVECYVQAQLKKVRPRIPKLKVDRLIFCVPNKTVAEKFAEFDAEIWNAEINGWKTTIKIAPETRDYLQDLRKRGQNYDYVIWNLIRRAEM